jgi:hypothetical protein
LADPTRRAIVARLARGDATVNELAAPFEMTLPGISKHLKVLERCGLISRSRHAQFRPCHLERAALDEAVAWIEAVMVSDNGAGEYPTQATFTDLGDGRTQVRIHQTNGPEAFRSPRAQAGFLTSLDRFAAHLHQFSRTGQA